MARGERRVALGGRAADELDDGGGGRHGERTESGGFGDRAVADVGVGVVGAGAFGRHHVRHYANHPGALLVAVADADGARAEAIAEEMTQRPQLTNRYMAVLFRQRISRRLTEGMALGMALESLTAANLAYAQQPDEA